jgi:ATP-binding cassette subfamily B protein
VFTVKNSLRKSAQSAASLNTLQGRLLDALSNFPVVKMFAQAKYEQNFVQPIRKKYQKDACNSHFWSRFFWAPGNLVMDTICFSIFIVLSGYMYSTGQSTVAEISFALATFTAISSVAFNMVMTIKNFTQKWGNAVGSYSVLVKPITIKDAENATELNVRTASINIKNISFKYNKRFILKNFNLSINPGEKVGLVGLSGAGKTTLVNLIMRMYDVNSGQIFIDDQDIKTVTQDSLRKNIAFIPQEPTMFNRTLRENIAYGKPDASNKWVVLAAKNASAHNFICETNDGYDTLVGDRGIKLSGGQRQRIAIARAFLKDSPILILDEATAALDSETEDAIQQSFKKLSHNRTTIVIAHRLSTLKNMDRIIVLDHGKIIESGSHNQLLRDGKIYSKLWKMQSGGFIQE